MGILVFVNYYQINCEYGEWVELLIRISSFQK